MQTSGAIKKNKNEELASFWHQHYLRYCEEGGDVSKRTYCKTHQAE